MLLASMHTKTNTAAKEMVELDMPTALERRTSFLEDDLALSSSAHDSLTEKTVTEPEEKTTPDETTRQSDQTNSVPDQLPVIYVSEDAMDCNYDESSNLSRPQQPQPQHFELEDAPSPELFESDADDEAESSTTTTTTSTLQKSLEEARSSLPSPKKLSTPERILKADKYLLRRVNKFLSGVPPPPNHTISQKDCDDFLVYIKQNRQYFWADPFKLDKKDAIVVESETSVSQQESNQEKSEEATNTNSKSFPQISQKAPLRNLSTAFDECEQSSCLKIDKNDSIAVDSVFSDTTSSFTLSDTLLNSSILSSSTFTALNDDSKLGDTDEKEMPPTLFTSVKCEEVARLSWPDVLKHKCPEIYYNRNKAMEEFENLRLKLCDRYIGAETQSTCNVWFAKQMPNSARKRNLLARRNMGQSPGKRLSYLARRRRTFSSANVQGLGLAEKKQVMLNMKKAIRKGKSPRGKSPRGKTPRKTPRSSAKKRHLRRLLLEGPSPRKSKIETSKRALFQSPPTDRPGPSRLSMPSSTVTTNTINNNPQKIKRALFPTPKKNEVDEISQSQPMNFVESRKSSQPQSTINFTESRKRKSEDDLEHSKHKWAKSLSFDCTRNVENSSSTTWNRHSTGSSLSKDGTSNYGKCELSDTNRKKLLWAVAEALRSKGIGLKDPMFKRYAATLARKVKMYMPELENKNVPRKPGSTSDRMLKLAKRHVLLIIEAKTAL